MKIPLFFAKRFVAGENADQAIKVVQELNNQGFKVSLDLLGENIKKIEDADRAIEEYKALFEKMKAANINGGVSIKLTQLGLDFGEQVCFEKTAAVLRLAKTYGIFVRIDMEGSKYTESTVSLFLKLKEQFDRVGLVLQAYLHRSILDVEKMVVVKASIRVCKGAYKESSSIAYESMEDVRSNYKKMVEKLLTAGCFVGLATHDDELIDWATKWLREKNIDPSLYEFQMLYGLRMKKGGELLEKGFQVRYYVPYGEHWFPYFYRRLRERKENVMFVLRSLIKG